MSKHNFNYEYVVSTGSAANNVSMESSDYRRPSSFCTQRDTGGKFHVVGHVGYCRDNFPEANVSEKNNTVFGYTNHNWNGVTCLQFAKICHELIEKNLLWKGCKHVFSPTSYTKKELVESISKHYDLNITVTPKTTEEKCDRTLNTVSNIKSLISIPELEVQIEEMKNFKL